MSSPGLRFDRDLTIAVYREVIADRDRAISPELRQEYEVLAQRLRALWNHWHGADTLHEKAFDHAPPESSVSN